ncbi:MAG: SDR family NAD(P)-dependent oxidoreductase [Alphaproteobacteria bacterium]|nr:SDR family NAD(P)-dependent oxidoreductase [Alphaproteobacteria bacterium]
MDFANQVAIVTGAGGNLGAAISRELASRGAKLVLVDQGANALARIEATLGDAELLLLGDVDLRKPEDTIRVVSEAVARFGRVDALANTVGTFQMGRIEENAAEQWQMLMDLNALTALLISKAALKAMSTRSYGRILHVAAGAGLKGGAGMSAYSASKAALMRVCEALSEEARALGVTANCILPNTIDTPQNREAMPDADTSSWVKPAAIAKVAAFLLSTDAGSVTGAAVPVTR